MGAASRREPLLPRARARIGSLHSGFQSAAKRAKLPPGLHQHDLRPKRVTDWLATGKSPVAVMHAMGHNDIQTTMGYYRFVPDHLWVLVTDDPPAAERPAEGVGEVARAQESRRTQPRKWPTRS